MNDKEQREFGYRAEDVIDLILERQKKYDAIDDKFKEQQRIWIRDLNKGIVTGLNVRPILGCLILRCLSGLGSQFLWMMTMMVWLGCWVIC